MGGVVEEDEVGGLCCVEELHVIMYVPKVPYLQESRRGSWGGGDGWIEDWFSFFLLFLFTAYVTSK